MSKKQQEGFISMVKLGPKGQIVIPKEARKMFGIEAGDSIVVLCDKDRGMALVKVDAIQEFTDEIMKGFQK